MTWRKRKGRDCEATSPSAVKRRMHAYLRSMASLDASQGWNTEGTRASVVLGEHFPYCVQSALNQSITAMGNKFGNNVDCLRLRASLKVSTLWYPTFPLTFCPPVCQSWLVSVERSTSGDFCPLAMRCLGSPSQAGESRQAPETWGTLRPSQPPPAAAARSEE